LDDVFELQDQITDSVVGIVEPSVRRSEIERSRRKRPESLSAYDLYLRALPHVMTLSHADASGGAQLLEDALKLDPDYAAARAYLAFCHQLRFVHDGRFDEVDKMCGIRHARAAIASGVDDATALAVAAITVAHLEKNFDASLDAIERALSHNASCAAALFFGGEIHAWKGESMAAVAYAQRALRLSPFDPLAYAAHIAMATAAIHEDRYDEAAAFFDKAAQANPGHGMFVLAQGGLLQLLGMSLSPCCRFHPAEVKEPHRSDFGSPCCLRPPVGGSAFGATHFRGHFCVHCCYGPVTRRLPTGDVVDRLQSLGFPPPCYPNYGVLIFAPAGLSPAEHASLRWTHNRTGRFPASGSRTRPHAVFRVRRHRQLLNIMWS
jgi:tetratricopeptide (TPR) repeat protein